MRGWRLGWSFCPGSRLAGERWSVRQRLGGGVAVHDDLVIERGGVCVSVWWGACRPGWRVELERLGGWVGRPVQDEAGRREVACASASWWGRCRPGRRAELERAGGWVVVPSVLSPACPVAFSLLVVSNCQNSHHFSDDAIEQAVWISVEDVPAGFGFVEGPSIGRDRYLLDGMLQLIEKSVFRGRTSFAVPDGSFSDLPAGAGVEFYRATSHRAHAGALPTAPPRGCLSPCLLPSQPLGDRAQQQRQPLPRDPRLQGF